MEGFQDSSMSHTPSFTTTPEFNLCALLYTDMKVSTVIPGASYASSTFSIPFSAINAILTTPITSEDSVEKLLFGLLEVVYTRQKDGFLSQPLISVEVSNRAAQQSVWEETPNLFSTADILSHLVSFNFDVGPTFSGNNLHPTAP
jgi:hypothetical protein